jgi:hypothetical protein
MKKSLLLNLLLPFLFIGCFSEEIEIIAPKEIVVVEEKAPEEVVSREEIKKIEKPLMLKEEKIMVEPVEVPKSLEERRLELKERLDREALLNSDKKLKAEELRDYKIDENTPLILRNQSEERAYE